MTGIRKTNNSLLQEGKTCWTTAVADRATLLVDADEYFRVLRAAMLQAEHHILIAGWDFDTRLELPTGGVGNAPAMHPEAPTELGEFLGFLIRRRPGLQIHVSRWDYHWLYRDDREPDTGERLRQHGVHFYADAGHPVTGCVHHKVVVIDDALAFCGGMDLTHKRWDTCLHDPDDTRRKDPAGQSYIPVHDAQICVSGPSAAAFGDYLRQHWPAPELPAPLKNHRELWPEGLQIDFEHIRTGICRTLPVPAQGTAVREIEAFYLAAIRATKGSLYIENQYFTSEQIAHALVEQCRREPKLEGLLVGLNQHQSAFECHTMGYGREQFEKILRDSHVESRLPLVAAMCGRHQPINVHSKVAVFDDRWLTIGSANLNRRSMGFDVECNVVLEAESGAHRKQMQFVRNRLLAEHLGLEIEEVARAIHRHGLARLPHVVQRARRLVRINPRDEEAIFGPILAPFFDRDDAWTITAPARPVAHTHRWVGAALIVSALTGAAFTTRVSAEDLETLMSLQKFVTQLLGG